MTQTASRRLRNDCRLALILCVALAPAAAEAQEGFSSRAGQLVRLPLSTDDSEVVPVEVGDPDVVGGLRAMALGPDGQLYAASRDSSDQSNRLYVVDPESAVATLVGELGIPDHRPSDMTFDDEGRLWLLARAESSSLSGTLYQVDHQTAAITELATGIDGLYALGFRGGAFYGIVDGAQESELWLASIHRETGDLTPILELGGFAEGPWCDVFPSDMDFDDQGRLWVAALWIQGCVITPWAETGIHFYANPFDGIQTSRSHVAHDGGYASSLSGFAVRGPVQPVVEIPTLSFGGALILAAALAAAAMTMVRRRPYR